MGLEEGIAQLHTNNEKTHQSTSICLHAFSDLSCISPVVFLCLLKACYVAGTIKATAKFRALQQQVHQILHNDPRPGPATFVAQCLYVLPVYEEHCEGFSHLIISALRRLLKAGTTPEDFLEAKYIAARLFLDFVGGSVSHEERIVVKILDIFYVQLIDLEEVICNSEVESSRTAKPIVEQYIFKLINFESYMTAVTLLEHFSIRQSGQAFLLKMIENKKLKAAEKWATFMGKPMLCLLVQEYIDRNMLKIAYDIIKKNNLRQEFADVYHKCKMRLIQKLAEKGCWDVAEARANNDRRLLEYLVYLAMEAGYSEKIDELCDRYSLKGFVKVKEPEIRLQQNRYLHLDELDLEGIVWVDEANGLQNATNDLEESNIIGVDCEWKPNYEKGSKPNKVSIMQIASERMVYIFDLIKLFKDVPEILDTCLIRFLQSPRVLKLGYNLQCDVQQLAHSYSELSCFGHYRMVLDLQSASGSHGGLSGLSEKILGVGLNKTRRNSNWEQRPLSQNQIEYAALDAAVLIRIFHQASVSEGGTCTEWKSHIVSYLDAFKETKKQSKKKK